MKIKNGVVIQKVGDSYVALATGKARENFNGMMRMNETAYFVASKMLKETNKEELVEALLSEYEVGREDAESCVEAVVSELQKNGLVE